jgi:hypothetical protein
VATHNLEATVLWPLTTFWGSPHDSDAGGWGTSGEPLAVYAVWPYHTQEAAAVLSEVHLDFSEVFVGAHGPEAEAIAKRAREMAKNQSAEDFEGWDMLFSTVVLLGSTWQGHYNHDRGEHFFPDRHDLTDQGTEVLHALEKLYGAEATLVTFLDT